MGVNSTQAFTYRLIANGVQLDITIPIGYYSLEDIQIVINNLLNKQSNNNYKLHLDKHKYRLMITSNYPFNIKFAEGIGSLKQLLGFKMAEYMTSNMYIAENAPLNTLFDHLYLKIFINHHELPRITSPKNNFNYFQGFSIKYEEFFGKNYYYENRFAEPFDIYEQINLDSLSLELWLENNILFTGQHVPFELVFSIEC